MKKLENGFSFYYSDNGPGVTGVNNGFGLKLINGLVSQLNGMHRSWNDEGYNFELIMTE
jgi:two-component sensor histidine kinase